VTAWIITAACAGLAFVLLLAGIVLVRLKREGNGHVSLSFGLTIPPHAKCIDNTGYPASLEVGRRYKILPPEPTDPDDYVRVIDESGEDYIYPRQMFK
jgi:hypothetical protein